MADNQNQNTDNSDQQSDKQTTTETFTWKDKLPGDMPKSPLLVKFEDNVEGLGKAFESHHSLEKLLGHDKVPIPKDDKDAEGWAVFSKALGIPDKAEGYGLPDAQVPEAIKEITFDKKKFAEVVHAQKLTPAQAKGLWKNYVEMNLEAYNKALNARKEQVTTVINKLKSEWGDAYDGNIELGQMVINKFSDDQEMNDFLTAQLTGDPRGVKFLSKIGSQFSENKIGEFSYKRFAKTPDQIEAELNSIRKDMIHPYNNEKATPKEREMAIDYVNSLIMQLQKAKG